MAPIDLFEQLFRGPGGLLVRLNWDALRPAGCEVDVEVLSTPEYLGDAFFPWYVGPAGTEVSYDSPGATPVCVGQIDDPHVGLKRDRREKIQRLRDSMVDFGGAVQLLIPCYVTPSRNVLVLDGCHRLAAALGAAMNVRGLLFSLHGPADSEILPDLAHFV